MGPNFFGSFVLEERFPDKFKPLRDIKKCDGKENPITWLANNKIAKSIQDVSESILTRYMPLVTKHSALTWIFGLLAKTIHSWKDMEQVFLNQ
jgi:hypothetical protein